MQRAASGAGNGTLISDTANTTQFRAAMIDKSQKTRWRNYADTYEDYVRLRLAEWYNDNKLSDAEFAFLLNYYGL